MMYQEEYFSEGDWIKFKHENGRTISGFIKRKWQTMADIEPINYSSKYTVSKSYRELQLDNDFHEATLKELIDLAIDLGDIEWFMSLTNIYKQKKEDKQNAAV